MSLIGSAACASSAEEAVPRLIETKRKDLVYTYLTYEHVPDETMRGPNVPDRPCRFRVRLPMGVRSPEDLTEPAPLVVLLHGRTGSIDRSIKWYKWPQCVLLIPDGAYLRRTPTGWFGYHDQYPNSPNSDARVHPYTLRRIAYTIRYVSQTIPIDRAEVWATGKSMGGAGALALAVLHPDLIAGADAAVCPVDLRLTPSLQVIVKPAWGELAHPLTVEGAGVSVWEYQSLIWQIHRDARRTGWLKIDAGKRDPIIPFEQFISKADPPGMSFIEALDAGRIAGGFVWDQREHTKKADPQWGHWYPIFQPLGERMIRLDRSFPSFSKASSGPFRRESRVGPWIAGADPVKHPRGVINPFFRWNSSTIEDTASRYSIQLWLDDDCSLDEISADVAIRNVQKFATPRGGRIRWEVLPTGGSGIIDIGMDGLPVAPEVPIPKGEANGVTLVLTHMKGEPFVVIDSPTHPNRTPRLGDAAEFAWKVRGSTEKDLETAVSVSTLFEAIPRDEDITSETERDFTELSLGTHYLHCRIRSGGKWGPTFTKEIYVDHPIETPSAE
jgi:pimeloyl-ACP methyl ester carboxylesterase